MEIIIIVAVVAFFMWRSKKRRASIAAPPELGAVGWTPGTEWRVLRPLARVEAWRLLRHPAFVIGVLITPLMFFAATESESQWLRVSTRMALALVPLGWMTIIAANLLALRPRRTGSDELLAAAPAPQPVRTTALLLSAIGAASVAAVLAAGWISVRSNADITGSPMLAEIAAGVLIVAGAVVIGVGTARWLPYTGIGALTALAVSFIQARFADVTTWPWNTHESHPARFLGFLGEPTSVGKVALELRPAGWHLAYLAGLCLLMAVVALARDGIPRRLGAVLVVAGVVIVGAGWAETRPPSKARVATMVSFLIEPRRHQRCIERAATSYCAYPEQQERLAQWVTVVQSVRRLLPEPVASQSLEVIDRVPTVVGTDNCEGVVPFLESLPPPVAREVTPEAVWPEDGDVHPGVNSFSCDGPPPRELLTAVQVGSWAVGLPSSPHGLDVRCNATGQARAVLALWLGAVVTPDGAALLRHLRADDTGQLETMLGVRFATDDIVLAAALLDVPIERVSSVLASDWDALTSDATPASVLADRFHLTARGAALFVDATTCP